MTTPTSILFRRAIVAVTAISAFSLSACAEGFSEADKKGCEAFIKTYESFKSDRASVSRDDLNRDALTLMNSSDKGVSQAATSWRDIDFAESQVDIHATPIVDACHAAGVAVGAPGAATPAASR
ncbi:hypothetical protein ACFXPI_10130 [Streptomyces sp. NPDC059104]|uniref:hypothetical protein n=1 Tax=Streptomyces sp. NPDC059104 TaxID=3346729 RepID=UPI003675C40D